MARVYKLKALLLHNSYKDLQFILQRNLLGREDQYVICLEEENNLPTSNLTVVAHTHNGEQLPLGRVADFYRSRILEAHRNNSITSTHVQAEAQGNGKVKIWLVVERLDQSWHKK